MNIWRNSGKFILMILFNKKMNYFYNKRYKYNFITNTNNTNMSNNETKETEVFRLTPIIGKFYEHADCTRREGRWPNEKYFVNKPTKYVGEFVRFVEGGYGDNRWRTDYFRDENGKIVDVPYKYEGTTCFREVAQKLPKAILDDIKNTVPPLPSLKSLAFYQQPTQVIIEARERCVI